MLVWDAEPRLDTGLEEEKKMLSVFRESGEEEKEVSCLTALSERREQLEKSAKAPDELFPPTTHRRVMGKNTLTSHTQGPQYDPQTL